MKNNLFKLHNDLKNKKVSSFELTSECLKNAKTAENNTFISLLEDTAIINAKRADDFIAKNEFLSILHGIPYTLKDLFVTEGIRTTAGSKILFNYIPPYDGFVSNALKNAGGILIGKVNLDEFGMGSTNENSAFGPVLNPLNKNKVPGGSSGGSAATLAENSSYYSIGTDTGGSSRLPANFCGLVGFKPTYGRISRYGQIAYASSLDQASPMAKSTLDIACIMEHLTQKDLKDGTNVDLGRMSILPDLLKVDSNYLKGKNIGFSNELLDGCSSEVKAELKKALENFRKAGANLIELTFPHLKHSVSAYYVIATCEASSNLSRYDGIHYGLRKNKKGSLEDTYIESRSNGFGEEVKKRILLGTFSLSSGYYDAYYTKACKVRRLIAEDFKNAFLKCDVVFSPVCATTAFDLGKSLLDPIQMYMNDLYTIPANLAGLPALSLPFGKDSLNMPTGFQLIGKAFDDLELLKLGHSFEILNGTMTVGGI